ncbi:MAG: hypothetical protein ACRDD2_02865 [Sarcina sp.]
MGSIRYWRDYLKYENNNKNTNDYLISFYINNGKDVEFKKRYYFFSNIKEIIKFIKYVVLPSFTYSKITKEEEDKILIEAIDYREMLNFFTINDKYYNKELIKKYSYFFNRLEELEYENVEEIETQLKLICKEINTYFEKDDDLKVSLNCYKNFRKFKSKMEKSKGFKDNIFDLINQMDTNDLIC